MIKLLSLKYAEFEFEFQLNHSVTADEKCTTGLKELYLKLDDNLRSRGTKFAFHVSQAVFTPDIDEWKLNNSPPNPSRYDWTEVQYQPNGPFDQWLKTVETCRTNVKCCENPRGIGNIILRDFPTPEFGAQVVNKNFQSAVGAQFECENEQGAT